MTEEDQRKFHKIAQSYSLNVLSAKTWSGERGVLVQWEGNFIFLPDMDQASQWLEKSMDKYDNMLSAWKQKVAIIK